MSRFIFKWTLSAIVFWMVAMGCNNKETPDSRVSKNISPKETTKKASTALQPALPVKKSPKSDIPLDMLFVPGGQFIMGVNDTGDADERPAHAVAIRDFLLDISEVTNAAYTACVKAGVCHCPASLHTEKGGFLSLDIFRSSDRPVNGVSHDDAARYCAFVDKRLPREAEWERAARGSDNRLFPWGNELPTPEVAVFRTNVTAPVGSHPKGQGPYGHQDLGGNVWEWVSDQYDPYAYTRDTADRGIPGTCPEILATQNELRISGKQGFTGTNPIPVECEFVLRGGAFNYSPLGLRSTNRVHHAGHFRIAMAGFRCAKDI